ncbi:hypothetical protein KR018_004314, partial [Drosophila ironensis]
RLRESAGGAAGAGSVAGPGGASQKLEHRRSQADQPGGGPGAALAHRGRRPQAVAAHQHDIERRRQCGLQ